MSTKGSQDLHYVSECLYRAGHGVYYVLVKVRGKQIKRSLKTTDLGLAKRRLSDFRKKAEGLNGKEKSITFDILSERWLKLIEPQLKPNSYLRRRSCVHRATPFFKGLPVRNIGNKEIEEWRINRSRKVKARSFNIELETLKILFRYAQENLKIILDNPFSGIKTLKGIKKKVEPPTRGQFQSLISEMKTEALSQDAVDFVAFLAYSALRVNEGNKVLWKDIDFQKETLRVTGGELGPKNHEARVIPLFPPLKNLLSRMKDQLGTSPLPDERVFPIDNAKKSISGACKRAGLPHWGHHAMRHFFCSNCIEAGIDFKTIAEWLGHKDGGVLVAKTYGHLRAEHSHAMAQKVTFELEQK